MSDSLPPNEYDGEPTMRGLYGPSLKLLAATIAFTYGSATLIEEHNAQQPLANPPQVAQAPNHEFVGPAITPTPTVADIMSRLAAHTAEATSPVAVTSPTPEQSIANTQIHIHEETQVPLPTTQELVTSTPTVAVDTTPTTPTQTISALPIYTPETGLTQVIPPTARSTVTHEDVRDPNTPTAQPTVETTDALIERFHKETGISIKLINELSFPGLEDIYSMQETDADTQLKKILASTILKLPKDVITAFKEKYKTIYIGRILASVFYTDEGKINFHLNEAPSFVGENVGTLDVADGPDYNPATNEQKQPSGLQAETEVTLAIAEQARMAYLSTSVGSDSFNKFVADNPMWIDFSNPRAKEFLGHLYFPYFGDGSDTMSSIELIARIQAMNIAGLQTEVANAIKVATDARLLDFSHAPLD